jgi:hypothetical protein
MNSVKQSKIPSVPPFLLYRLDCDRFRRGLRVMASFTAPKAAEQFRFNPKSMTADRLMEIAGRKTVTRFTAQSPACSSNNPDNPIRVPVPIDEYKFDGFAVPVRHFQIRGAQSNITFET